MSTAEVPAAPALDPATLAPFEDSTELLGQPEALRARAKRDGYLFFRGLIEPEPILELRQAVLAVLDRHGLRAADAGPLSGKLDVAQVSQLPVEDLRPDVGVSHQIYYELYQLPKLHRISHHEALLSLYRTLFDGEVFVHPRRVMRAFMPHPALTATPPHQDFPLFQGSTDIWTCWFPIGSCPLAHGPLVILRGSHHNGYLPIKHFDAAADWSDWGTHLCDYENDWVGGDFAVGDVLTFSSLTVHRAAPKQTLDEIRISLDVRYQQVGDEIGSEELNTHVLNPTTKDLASWDEIYQGWTADEADLMYYWQRKPDLFSMSEWDDSLIDPANPRIC